VESVDDLPTIMIPSSQIVDEDGSTTIRGIALYDADVMMSDLIYQLTVSCLSGSVTLYSDSHTPSHTSITNTPATKTVEATVSTLNALLQELEYTPNPHFNDFHPTKEIVTITLIDLSLPSTSTTNTVSASIPVSVVAFNDAPSINVPKVQRIKLAGFTIFNVDNDLHTQTTVHLAVDNEFASMALTSGTNSGVSFIAGSSDSYSRNIEISGSMKVSWEEEKIITCMLCISRSANRITNPLNAPHSARRRRRTSRPFSTLLCT